MTTVRIDLRAPDGPATGSVQWTPTRRRSLEDHIVLPSPVSVPLVDGVALVELEPTGPDWAWKAQEWATGHTVRYVAVPDLPGLVQYTDLVDVDPSTLAPSAEPEAAWWAALEAVQAGSVDPDLLDEAVEARLAAHVDSPTPHPAYDEIPSLSLIFRNRLL